MRILARASSQRQVFSRDETYPDGPITKRSTSHRPRQEPRPRPQDHDIHKRTTREPESDDANAKWTSLNGSGLLEPLPAAKHGRQGARQYPPTRHVEIGLHERPRTGANGPTGNDEAPVPRASEHDSGGGAP